DHPQREQAIGLDEAGARLVLGADVDEDALDGDDLPSVRQQRVDRAPYGDLDGLVGGATEPAQACLAGGGAPTAARLSEGEIEGLRGSRVRVGAADEVPCAEGLVEGHAQEPLRVAVEIRELPRVRVEAEDDQGRVVEQRPQLLLEEANAREVRGDLLLGGDEARVVSDERVGDERGDSADGLDDDGHGQSPLDALTREHELETYGQRRLAAG